MQRRGVGVLLRLAASGVRRRRTGRRSVVSADRFEGLNRLTGIVSAGCPSHVRRRRSVSRVRISRRRRRTQTIDRMERTSVESPLDRDYWLAILAGNHVGLGLRKVRMMVRRWVVVRTHRLGNAARLLLLRVIPSIRRFSHRVAIARARRCWSVGGMTRGIIRAWVTVRRGRYPGHHHARAPLRTLRIGSVVRSVGVSGGVRRMTVFSRRVGMMGEGSMWMWMWMGIPRVMISRGVRMLHRMLRRVSRTLPPRPLLAHGRYGGLVIAHFRRRMRSLRGCNGKFRRG